jgi:hypothetical protein
MNRLLLGIICLLILFLLIGCDIFNRRINEPAEPTNTPLPFSTATPGGKISIWMIEPTDLASAGTPAPQRTVEGQVVAPAATATAIQAQIIAATQTAAAPTPQPTFQPDDCPETRGLNAPNEPDSFTEFPAAIGVFLSNGGAPSVLESTLRQWGAITGQGGVVQGDTDLTGDKIPEILVNMFNPFIYNPEAALNSGQMLIYGCDNKGYRLLYATPNNPGIALPVLHRVGDMNGDVKAEVVLDTQSCSAQYCTREGFILSWNPVVGIFEPINSQQILAINGRLGVVDIDSDGILELTVTSNPPVTATSGPTRGIVDVWDWTGQNYLLAVRTPDEAHYRIHRLHDADEELFAGNRRNALAGYFDVRDNADLLAWTLPNETVLLRAFATFRIVTTYARNGDERAESMLGTLLGENPEGTPGAVYAAMGRAFMEAFRSGSGATAACQSALSIAATRSEVLAFLNSYGFANRSYSLSDLCPF